MASVPPLSDEDRTELVAFLDGELEGEAAHAVEGKLQRDPRLRAEAETLRRAWELLDYLPRPEPSTDFSSRTLERISAVNDLSRGAAGSGRWRTWALGIGWAAAVLIAAAVGYDWMTFVWHGETPGLTEPMDLEEQLVHDLRVIENKRLYEHVDNLDFLRALDSPELFGDDS